MKLKLPKGAVLAPVILASDKTNLSQFGGDKQAWPVYLTLGNISKGIRRQPSSHGSVLIGYLLVAKLACFSEGARANAQYRLFHQAMRTLLRPLVSTGQDGVLMTCADSKIQRVYPILAAYVADYPEQCLVAACNENRCPKCTVWWAERGEYKKSPLRTEASVRRTLQSRKDGDDPVEFDLEGLREIYSPFWADLPHTDIFLAITPDILHQLHKGVFKDHFVKWCTSLVGEQAIDDRFRAMSSHPHLRHFKKGISSISQWTGKEHKEMQKVFLGVLAGIAPPRLIAAARGLLDFIYYAQYQSHTTETLRRMQEALELFHANKDIFVNEGIREHFNISKLHSLIHYTDSIILFGSLDGFNSEHPERLHIDYAKKGYRASNKRDYVIQMTRWLQRQEAMDLHAAYLQWLNVLIESQEDLGVLDPEPEEPMEDDDGEAKYRQEADYANTVLAELKAEEAPSFTYNIAKKSPFPNTSVARITSAYGATEFLPALQTFLDDHLPRNSLKPNQFDRFDLYNAISILLPSKPHVSDTKRLISVRATAERSNGLRKPSTPARFDTAVVIEDEKVYEEGQITGTWCMFYYNSCSKFRIFSRSSCSRDSSDLQAAVTVRPFLTTSRICPLVHTFPCLGPTAGYVQAVSIHPTPSSECSRHLCKPDRSNLPPHTEVWICGHSPPLVQR